MGYNTQLNKHDMARMIGNTDNPKTMDYYTMRILDVSCNGFINSAGNLNFSIRSQAARASAALELAESIEGNTKRGQLFFVLDVFADNLLPKSRLLRIIRNRSLPVMINNPLAGSTREIKYTSGYIAKHIEPDLIHEYKRLVLYCRNAWDRRSELKIKKEPDATAT